jgi:hypothetical protein
MRLFTILVSAGANKNKAGRLRSGMVATQPSVLFMTIALTRSFNGWSRPILSRHRQFLVGKPDQVANLAQFADPPVESLAGSQVRVDPRLFFRRHLIVDEGADELIGKLMTLAHLILRISACLVAIKHARDSSNALLRTDDKISGVEISIETNVASNVTSDAILAR